MTQYTKSGPSVAKPPSSTPDTQVDRLERQIEQQDLMIKELQKAVRRLKDKLDRHADYLNRGQRG